MPTVSILDFAFSFNMWYGKETKKMNDNELYMREDTVRYNKAPKFSCGEAPRLP